MSDADLEIPYAPSDVAPRDREDARAQLLIERNGFAQDTQGLIALLKHDNGLVAAAAARVLGIRGAQEAVPWLRELARDPNDLTAVHAAAALAKFDEPAGRAELERIADLPFEAYPGAIQAAGELAILGDASRADVVERALASGNPALVAIAEKQRELLTAG